MTLTSRREAALMRAVIDAFRPLDCAISTEQATTRALQFINTLDRLGSDRVEEIRKILSFLDMAMLLVDLENRGDVRKRLNELEDKTFLLGVLGEQSRGLARFAQRLSIICLYSSLDSRQRPAAAMQLGYDIYEDRGFPTDQPVEPMLPAEVFAGLEDAGRRQHDVVVVGSGSGGSVLVRRLVEDHGLDVGLVELGDYVPEGKNSRAPDGTRRPLPHDEMLNLLHYYKHGGLQLTQGIPMFVFQGQCLGGSSVINNAVCFKMPPRQRQRWAARHGVSWATEDVFDRAYERVARDIGIGPVDEVAQRLNPSARFMTQGAAAIGASLDPCVVNLSHDPQCLGCGYCNLTCAYLRKNSVLQTMLPPAVASARAGRGKLTIYTGARALRVEMGDDMIATGVVLQDRAGRSGPVVVGARRSVAICSGAIGSTGVLERTEVLNKSDLPLGNHLSFNFGSPVHADFDAPVRAFDGVQIAHFHDGRVDDGLVIETWYNPPATQALALPGWLDEMIGNLARYSHFACAAPLVRSSSESTVDAAWKRSDEDINVRLGDRDLDKLKVGLELVCDMFFAADPAPRRVLIGALDDWELSRDNYRDRIRRLQGFDEIQVGTGHPQGGNCMSSNDGNATRKGVVGTDFRVHGARNLFVADASVIPSSIGVNPHWTVMALAELAAPHVAG